MNIKAIKIHAEGCTWKRFVTLSFDDKYYKSFIISQDLYDFLKENGIPTSQKLRYEKSKNTNHTKN